MHAGIYQLTNIFAASWGTSVEVCVFVGIERQNRNWGTFLRWVGDLGGWSSWASLSSEVGIRKGIESGFAQQKQQQVVILAGVVLDLCCPCCCCSSLFFVSSVRSSSVYHGLLHTRSAAQRNMCYIFEKHGIQENQMWHACVSNVKCTNTQKQRA